MGIVLTQMDGGAVALPPDLGRRPGPGDVTVQSQLIALADLVQAGSR